MKTPSKFRARLRTKLSAAKRSWTVWFNLAIAAVGAGFTAFQANLPLLTPVISPQWMVGLGCACAAINVVLRVRNAGKGE